MNDMLKFLQTVESEGSEGSEANAEYKSTDMKKLLETVVLSESEETVKFDSPESGKYANEGDPKTLPASAVGNGDDLHKPKDAYKNANGADNAMKLKEDIKSRLENRWAVIKEQAEK